MDESEQNSETLEQVFNDFKGRRAGIVKALTTDVEKFFQLCDPEKDNLCLYGVPNGTWTVSLPTPELPSVLPDPSLGINFARDGTQYEDWLGLVAVHSDVWLLSLAFYFGARFGFDKADRKKLHDMINDLPTIYEVVLGSDKKQSKERSSVSSNSSNKSKSNSKQCQAKDDDDDDDEDEDEEEEFEELEEVPRDTLCAACGERYAGHEFWICCDVCGKWFHVQCEKITPGRAEYIKHCKFPCSDKRAHA